MYNIFLDNPLNKEFGNTLFLISLKLDAVKLHRIDFYNYDEKGRLYA